MTRHGVALNARQASKCQKEGASVCSLDIHTFLQTFFHVITYTFACQETIFVLRRFLSWPRKLSMK